MSSSTSTLPGIQIPNMKKIEMDVLDNRRFAGFLQAVFSTFLGTQPFPAHILPCLEELAKELQTKRHSTQYNNKSTTLRGKCQVCQSIQINFLGESVNLSLRVGEYVKLSSCGITRGTACLCHPYSSSPSVNWCQHVLLSYHISRSWL